MQFVTFERALCPICCRIPERTPAPVFPISLSGLWEGIISRNPKRARLSHLLPAVHLNLGQPLPPDSASPAVLRDTVIGLREIKDRRTGGESG